MSKGKFVCLPLHIPTLFKISDIYMFQMCVTF